MPRFLAELKRRGPGNFVDVPFDPREVFGEARPPVLDAARVKHIPASDELTRLEAALKKVNEDLWVIEDDIRQCEADKDFGQTFIDLARSVYIQNDKRAALKKDINLLTGSTIIEEKSYTEFN